MRAAPATSTAGETAAEEVTAAAAGAPSAQQQRGVLAPLHAAGHGNVTAGGRAAGKRRRSGDGDGGGGQPGPSEPIAGWAVPAADTFLRGLDVPQESLRIANIDDGAAKRPLPGFADVYVGRHTDFGNPFPMGKRGRDETMRGRVCDAFQALIEAPPGTRAVDVAANRGLRST